ncbi:PIG-L family deacetylase [Amycolatopsis silviterrae]|uniref:PIG-L family deacetylase n=1 Tax=Amycolatopsis silviterrae TaxID=1656914 RepID=A0ABW5H6Q5_9PSEU
MKALRRIWTAAALAVLAVSGMAASAGTAAAEPTTTLSFVAHQDDDLLFMNPDIASDIQAGYNVWVTYLTAGELPCASHDPCGMDYANMRIDGVRAAYARAAHTADDWTYELMQFGDHQVPVDHLNGTNLHLVFTYLHGAAGPEDNCGDLYRMLNDDGFEAMPIDDRPGYRKADFLGMINGIIDYVNPDYIRSQSTIGHRDKNPAGESKPDHVDHIAGAILVADADVDENGNTRIRRDEYQGYVIQYYPDNVDDGWRQEKQAMWDQYKPHDPVMGPNTWDELAGKQYRPLGRIFEAGTPWVPPGDFSCEQ